MRGHRALRTGALAAAAVGFVFILAGGASAQTPTPTATGTGATDCADFATQQAAQAFYDQHKADTPGNQDPFDLDTDGDGIACEGLPSSASPTPGATTTPATTATPGATGQPLPNNGAETGVIALSGLSLIEAGYGLTLASKRLGIRRRAVPLYLLRKFVRAADRGEAAVEVGEDMYLVHRSVLESSVPVLPPIPEVPAPPKQIDWERERVLEDDEVEIFDIEVDEPAAPTASADAWPNVYAAIAKKR